MKVFKKKERKAEPGFSVGVLLSRKETKGKIGLEIEVEGRNLPHENVSPYWSYHEDHSLRGEENAEYVLSRPVEFDVVPKALATLWAKFKERGSVLDDSNRTSVHVHLNVQEFHLNRLTSFMAMYLALEEVLTEFCGEHRVGNMFCLRAKDAPAIVSSVKRFIEDDGQSAIFDQFHYAAMNANALHKFGSLEFRTLRGVSDPQVIEDWVSILQRLYEKSADYPDPRDICGTFSQGGPVAFFDELLGGKADLIRKASGWDNDRIRDSMYEGIRLAQGICYCRDWDLFKAVSVKPDPFGRDAKKIAKAMAAHENGVDPWGITPNLGAVAAGTVSVPLQSWAVPPPQPAVPSWMDEALPDWET